MRTIVFLSAICIVLPASAQEDHDWQVYENGRFAYSVCYPADLLSPQPEAENGDGRMFNASDGASLRVYGLNNALDDSISQAAASEAPNLGGVITYRVVTSNGYVLSGRRGSDIFYEKTVLAGGQFKTFVLTYPAGRARTYDPIVTRIAGCFRS